jgi:hypothetical protein
VTRLTDNDFRFGPLTFGRTKSSLWLLEYRSHGCDISGQPEDEPGNSLLLYTPGWCFRLRLPQIIRPVVERKQADWDAETVARLGRDYYDLLWPREYGLSYMDGHFTLRFGMHSDNHQGRSKKWSCFLPWTQWQRVRYSLYNPDGSHFFTRRDGQGKRGVDGYREQRDAEKRVPKVKFDFLDFDDSRITATCHIEEREWRFGTGWFRWLGWLRKPKIRRSLDLEFSAEVGPEKGSWKGGTVGHGIDMLPGESCEAAFRRYCEINHERKGRRYHLTFLGPTATSQDAVEVAAP